MSDRYRQLDLVDYLDELHPNFQVGDIVYCDPNYRCHLKGGFPDYLRGTFTITELISDWAVIQDVENGHKSGMNLKGLRKVRVHLELVPELPLEQEHKSPSIHYEIKEIKGRKYKYARWREGDRHKSKYIGRA